MMQSNNIVELACAGSGKTWRMCHDSICCDNSSKKMLMISYTHKGIYSIKKEYAQQNQGVLGKNIIIYTWFQFLLRELIKPYQRSFLGKICQVRSCDFSQLYGIDYSHKNSKEYFLNCNYDVKANHASEFAVLLNKLSAGAVIKRLEETYSCIYIDELQDLVGYDIDLLELLFLSSIKIYCVGDYKQATLKTHNPKSNKTKGGMYVFKYLETIKESHRLNIIKNNTSRRFISDIAQFINLFYLEDPVISIVECNEQAIGVFQITEDNAPKYIQFYSPTILKYDIKTSTLNYPSLNFGVSKGMTLDRVLIFPNGPLTDFLIDPSKKLKAPDRYYVGVTRAKYSLTFVVKKLIENKYFKKSKICIGDDEIDVLKFNNSNHTNN
ncbi:MAG: UvrD-helicase domain-containing protein [Bacillota bacterium]|nr:UvrD-helicase domain-containing protein [Bacillota bacterium]